ncbi:hypothetical protein CFIO01_00544 [Colletotrichum fioriniae PJ7]|uniref:Phage tail collar domain-containing protein n=1 Tax=Colletotrichum fioriniae PJ7 TaxID=1445577 RepID=A0A010QZS4_9PEZI|nr:hypothetical protein CFIO01_00544 [Colletotrichum fioriniae PJ7]
MPGNAKATNGSVIGWRLCDGSSLAKADFSDLFAVIGNANGGKASKGQGTFNISDLRARLLRGASARKTAGTVLSSTTYNPFQVQVPYMPDD